MWRLFSCPCGTGIAVMKEVTPRFCPSVSHSLLSWCSSCSTRAGAVGRWFIGIVWPLRIRRPDQETSDRSTVLVWVNRETLEVPWPRSGSDALPVHRPVDSTGQKLCGPGAWLTENLVWAMMLHILPAPL